MVEHIQIADVAPRVQYLANGVQIAFTYPFPIFKAEDLEVFLGTQKQSAGYSVSGAGLSSGGTVIFPTPPGNGVLVTLRRHLSIQRITDHQADGVIRAKTINDELDFQTAALQQLDDELARCARRPATSGSTADLSLPDPVAGRALKWSAAGDRIVNSDSDPDTLGNAVAGAETARAGAEVARDLAVAARQAAEAARDEAQAAVGALVDPLAAAANLSDLPDKGAARTNLSVYSQAETDAAIAANGLSQAVLDRLTFLELNLAVNTLRDQIDTGWSVLKMVDGIADEFEDETGVATKTGATYDASGDYYHNPSSAAVYGSDVTSSACAISSGTMAGYSASSVFDNNTASNPDWQSSHTGSQVAGNAWIGQDFGAGVTRHIRRVTIQTYYSGNPSNLLGCIRAFAVEYSDDGTNWTAVSTHAAAQTNSKQSFDVPASGPHRYWRLRATDNAYDYGAGYGNTWGWGLNEAEMIEISSPGGSSDVTLVSTATAAQAQPDEARLVILHQSVGVVTLNTDLIVEASRDGGTSWTAAALTREGAFDTTTDVLTGLVSLAGQPAGSSMKWRLRTLNNKEQRIHGVWMQWR